MTVTEGVALIGAITGLVVALGAIYAQVRATHQLVNSRMTQLIESVSSAKLAEGKLAGADAKPDGSV